MPKIDKNVNYRNRKGFSSFDISHEVDFSSSCGHLLPVMYDILSPGERVDLQYELKTRTQPLDAAASLDIEECIDTFFVPINQLYVPFKSIIYGIEDVGSDFYSIDTAGRFGQIGSTIPYVTLANLKTLVQSTAGTNEASSQLVPSWAEVVRFLDLINIPWKAFCEGAVDGDTGDVDLSQSVSLLVPCAYQKIFMDFYRISDYQPNDPQAYNLDSLYTSPELTTQSRLAKLFKLRRVPYAPDIFTNIKPSPMFGPSDINAVNNSTMFRHINQWLSAGTDVAPLSPSSNQARPSYASSKPTTVGMGVGSPATGNATISDLQSFMNPANIRAIFAAEKLYEVTRRAGKHYDAQTAAHFGFDVNQGIEGQAYFIGHHQQRLQIGDVVSTAATEDESLGTIAGRAYSFDRSNHARFTAPCHGVLMSIFYIKPRAKYTPVALDKLHQLLYPNDFYHPEFDNLGMQPLFHGNLIYNGGTAATNAAIEGWQYRYMELKKKKNAVHGALASSLDYWTFNRRMPVVNALNLCVSPSDLNSNFLLQYKELIAKPTSTTLTESEWYSQVFDGDNFMNFLQINYNKASRMSTFGLPNLDTL